MPVYNHYYPDGNNQINSIESARLLAASGADDSRGGRSHTGTTCEKASNTPAASATQAAASSLVAFFL